MVTWLDRAQSTGGHFDTNAGYMLCEIDGESYAVSGRYLSIPDPAEASEIVCALHIERFPPDLYLFDDEISAYTPDDVAIICKRKRHAKKTGLTFVRFTPGQNAARDTAYADPA